MTSLLNRFIRPSGEQLKESRNFLWNTIGLAANSFNSLFFLIIVTRVNGISDSGIFSLCFNNAIVFLAIALYGVRAYQVTDVNNDYSNGEYVMLRIATSLGAILVALAFVLINRYDPYKVEISMILATAKIVEAMSDVYYGVFQRNGRLDLAGKANFLKSLLGIAAFLLTLLFTHYLLLACTSLLAVNLGVLFLYEIYNVNRIDRPGVDFHPERLFSILKTCFPVFVVSVLALFLLNFPRYAIDRYMTSTDQGVYGILVMPGTTISLFTSFLIQYFLSVFAEKYANRDKIAFMKLIIRIVGFITLITIFFEIFCYFFGMWLLRIFFGYDLHSYLPQFLFIILGAYFISLSAFFCSILTTMRQMTVQLYIYLADFIIAVVCSPLLVSRWGLSGAAGAYDLIAGFQTAIVLAAMFWKIQKSKNFIERDTN